MKILQRAELTVHRFLKTVLHEVQTIFKANSEYLHNKLCTISTLHTKLSKCSDTYETIISPPSRLSLRLILSANYICIMHDVFVVSHWSETVVILTWSICSIDPSPLKPKNFRCNKEAEVMSGGRTHCWFWTLEMTQRIYSDFWWNNAETQLLQQWAHFKLWSLHLILFPHLSLSLSLTYSIPS